MKRIFKSLGIVCLVILISVFLLLIVLLIKSKAWEREFNSEIKQQYLVSSSELDESLEKKIEGYIVSEDSTNFVTLSPQEVGAILFGSLSEMVDGTSFKIENVYIEPSEGVWEVCTRVKARDSERLVAWVCGDVTKDSMETAQLFVTSLSVQGINIGRIYPKSITMVNQGIAEALVTANENGFVGRVFENIELLEDELIVKGSLY